MKKTEKIYRLIKRASELHVIEGYADKFPLMKSTGLYKLAETFQGEDIYKKYLKINKSESGKDKYHDFSQTEIIIRGNIAYIIN